MSWEEYGIRMMAYAEKNKEIEAQLRYSAWINNREVQATNKKGDYIYRQFKDFYQPEDTHDKKEVFNRLRRATALAQNYKKGGA